MNHKKIRTVILQVLKMLFGMCLANLQAQSLTLSAQVAINVKPVSDYGSNKPVLICELKNIGASTVEYDQWLDTLGFDFRLVDQGGEIIKMNDSWFKRFSPRYREWSKTKTARLSPGEVVMYRLNLREAFGNDWHLGSTLYIDWHQQGSISQSPTLTRNIKLPATQVSPEFNLPPREAQPDTSLTTTITPKAPLPALRPLATRPTPTRSEEPASSTPWSIIVVLIAAAIGLLWLLVK